MDQTLRGNHSVTSFIKFKIIIVGVSVLDTKHRQRWSVLYDYVGHARRNTKI